MVFVTFFVEDAVRLVTGSSNADVIYNTALYLRISFPLIPTMAVIIILRNMLQGMNHLMMPLVCSSLELIGKVNFCYLGRAGIWVFCSVPLRTGHMGGLLYFCFDLRIFVQEGIEIEA